MMKRKTVIVVSFPVLLFYVLAMCSLQAAPRKSIDRWGLLAVIEMAQSSGESSSRWDNIRESITLLMSAINENIDYSVLSGGHEGWRYIESQPDRVRIVIIGDLLDTHRIAEEIRRNAKAFVIVKEEPNAASREGILAIAFLAAAALSGGEISESLRALRGRSEAEINDLITNYGCCGLSRDQHSELRRQMEDISSDAFENARQIIDFQRTYLAATIPRRSRTPYVLVDGRYLVMPNENAASVAIILADKILAEKNGLVFPSEH